MKTRFQASKTVLAMTVAGLISGGAFAAPNNFTKLTVGADSSIAFIGSDPAKAVGKVTGDHADKNDQAFSNENKDTIADQATVTLKGGTIEVSAKAPAKAPAVEGEKKLGSVTGTGMLNITALNAAQGGDARNATLTLNEGDFSQSSLNINFGHLGSETAEQGQAILTVEKGKDMTFGSDKAIKPEAGPPAMTAFVVSAGTEALVGDNEAASNILLNNVTISNAGSLTFEAKSGIFVKSDLDLADSTGVTIFDGASTLTGSFTGSKVLMGNPNNEENLKAFNQIFTESVVVEGGVFSAQDMTVDGNQLKVANGGKFIVNGR